MKYLSIDKTLFVSNRQKFAKKLKPKSLAVFNSNDILPTNADGTMPFKQNSDLFWLSGVDQEETVLLVFSESSQNSDMLFLKKTNEHIAIWEGEKLSKEKAREITGIKNVYWIDEFNQIFNDLVNKMDNIYLNKNMHSRSTSEVETRDDRFRKKIINKFNHPIIESAPILHNLRSIKDPIELDLMRKACNITEKGLRRILPMIKPGVMEYEIEAELIHEFIKNRSKGFAYQPIIGSGRNSCVLHYIENNKQCEDGDILLMDFGAEYANYASDLTRTVPVNGLFSQRQKDVYNSVLHVMRAATLMLRPGTVFKDYNVEVGKIMESELIKLNLLDKHDIKKQDKKNPLYKKYFMHGTSHFLGLDVHDVGDFNVPMKEGMVFTCEPGIYILKENLGVRLENDILITSKGAEDLMKNIPIEVEEIEDLMCS
ncbi:MAG: X-Pro aminopeptidase [Flavobacteriales bacterium]|nr:X-Pro aminopeptidase [Flavobacteriales bacterium]|tara:strand:- start:374 stop:1654 length:1281 start_codon:yes stop_codon:yes gene_type:complete